MKLTFDNGTTDELVAEFSTYSELIKAINDYLKKLGIKPDYFRWVGLKDDRMMIDFGSHYKFFYIDQSFETINKLELDEKSRDNKNIPDSGKKGLRFLWRKCFKKS